MYIYVYIYIYIYTYIWLRVPQGSPPPSRRRPPDAVGNPSS